MTESQQRALQAVRAQAQNNQAAATHRITAVLNKHGLDIDVAAITGKIRETGVVAINFHPSCKKGSAGHNPRERLLSDLFTSHTTQCGSEINDSGSRVNHHRLSMAFFLQT